MKRLLLVLLALVPGIVLLVWLGAQGEGVAARWQRLPSGGEVRVRGVTFGTEHEMENDDRSLQQRVRDWWKGPRPKGGPSPFALRKVKVRGEHSLQLWVEQRNMPGKNLRIPYATLRLPEGDDFPDTKKSTWPNAAGRVLSALRFPLVPYREKTLHFTVSLEGEEFACEVTNPAARVPLPMWTPSPLPQTAREGDVELSLRSLPVSAMPTGHVNPWTALPEWDITDAGRRAKDWYSITHIFEDPGGNSSPYCGLLAEPVWRVRAVARRTREYPHVPEDVRWLGTIDPAAIGPEAALALDDATKLRGVSFVGVLPTGHHAIDQSGAVKTMPNSPSTWPSLSAADRAFYLHAVPVNLDEPSVVVLSAHAHPLLVWHGPDGVVRPVTARPTNNGSFRLQTAPLPRAPTPIGIAGEHELTFDFYVAAPERPKVAPSPAPR